MQPELLVPGGTVFAGQEGAFGLRLEGEYAQVPGKVDVGLVQALEQGFFGRPMKQQCPQVGVVEELGLFVLAYEAAGNLAYPLAVAFDVDARLHVRLPDEHCCVSVGVRRAEGCPHVGQVGAARRFVADGGVCPRECVQ